MSKQTSKFDLTAKAFLAAIALSFFFSWYLIPDINTPLFKSSTTQETIEKSSAEANYQATFASDGSTALVHASSSVELANGNIMAVWFAGSREGGRDVTIDSAVYDPKNMSWGNRRTLATPWDTQHQLQRYVRKLGNPVITRDVEGRLWLFYVSVSFGGWAASSINFTTSDDMGESWQAAQRLIVTPFFNLSTLVRGIPYNYQDGSIALPVYHELAGKFGELLRISPEGKVLDKQRLATGRQSLQPIIFPLGEKTARVLMRYSGKSSPNRALAVYTDDAGEHWSEPKKSDIENPNSALTGVVLEDGKLLVVANDTEDHRDRLSLLLSEDQGKSWRVIHRFEDESQYREKQTSPSEYKAQLAEQLQGDGMSVENKTLEHAEKNMCSHKTCEFQFDYPYLTQTKQGDFHLLYTWNKSFTKHIRFNQTWLEQQL